MVNIVIISFSLKKGGAAIAASRFAELLSGKAIRFEVDFITQDHAGKSLFFKRLISHGLVKLQFDGNPIKHSLNLFTYPPVLGAFKKSGDVLCHLHWINNDTLSVFDFDKIPSGSIMTLHDEWLYCGAEHHYKLLDYSNDFQFGYRLFKRGIFGINWNYLVWRVKHRKLAHRNDLIYTVPSSWMFERARSSAILSGSDVRILPNPIDTDVFKPASESDAQRLRFSLNITADKFIFVFGAIGGRKNKLKGLDYLEQAFAMLARTIDIELGSRLVLVEFGGLSCHGARDGFRSISVGHIKDSEYLAKLYSMADCVIVPSLVESFGQVAAEALSCETPVVCFNTSGLRDIVLHRKTGLVASAFDVGSLRDCLLTMISLTNSERLKLSRSGRQHVLANFSYPVVYRQYLRVLEDAVKLRRAIF